MGALDRLFRPRAVALVGASRDRYAIGGAILHNLIRAGFRGTIYPVNPRVEQLQGLTCYPSVDALPSPVDLAIIAVPRPAVIETLRACGRARIGAAVLITAGYRETGADGRALEDEVVEVARTCGIRLVGPNCMGIMNMADDVRLQASFSASLPVTGTIAFASQSGAVGEALLALLHDRGLGLSMFVSLGNKADVSSNDLLAEWGDDPATRVILLYMESFGHPQKFLDVAARVTRHTPVIAVKAGRSAAGARAAASHTGALAGSDGAVDALLAQSGVIRADTVEECVVYASALATQPLPAGPRVAVITNAGGPAILATDTAVACGLQIATLTNETTTSLRALLPPEASVRNPIDMIASAQAPQYEAVVTQVAADPGVDALIVIFTALETNQPAPVADAIIAATRGLAKPVLVCFMGTMTEGSGVTRLREAGLPVYTFGEDAARALSVMVRYQATRQRPADPPEPRPEGDWPAIAGLCETLTRQQRRQLTLAEAQRVLEWAGIPVWPWREVASAAEVPAALAGCTFPVVAKVSSATIVHKSDVGGVILGLDSCEAVSGAVSTLLERARVVDPVATVVLQQQAPAGVEVIAGAVRDPRFGPLVMCGLGGVFVEVFKDVSLGVHPLRRSDIQSMLRRLKAFPLLDGARGRPKADLVALEDILRRLDALMVACPAIAEVDINPLIAAPVGSLTAAADARVTLGSDGA
jgi:acetyl coenzyme A synthetase (ADP forming)-like protein